MILMNKLALLPLLALGLTACLCDDTELAIGDIPNLFLAEAYTDGSLLIIRFSHPVDTASLQAEAGLLIEGDSITYTGNFSFPNDSTVIIALCALQCLQEQCAASLILKSQEGKPSVRSQTGQLLDGDRDGISGGDYIKAFLVPACQMPPPPRDPTIVLSPAANQMNSMAYSITPDKRLYLSVEFNAPIDTSTVVDGATFMLFITELDQPLPGMIAWVSDTSFAFTSGPLPEYCAAPDDYHIQLTIKGSSDMLPPTVLDTAGVALDGDKDGIPGGDFTTRFLIESAMQSVPFISNLILGMYDPPHIIEFSEPMDTASAIPGISISVQSSCAFGGNLILDNYISLSWSNENRTLTIFHDYQCPTPPDGPDKITLTGGCDALKSACGVPLDGDGDGQPGGVLIIGGP